jgi:hypothetical protein
MKPQHEGGGGTWSVPEYVMVRSIMVVEHCCRCGRGAANPVVSRLFIVARAEPPTDRQAVRDALIGFMAATAQARPKPPKVRPPGIGLGEDRAAKARKVASKVRAAQALSRALDLAPVIKELRDEWRNDSTSHRRGTEPSRHPDTRRQGAWQAAQVSQLLARLK